MIEKGMAGFRAVFALRNPNSSYFLREGPFADFGFGRLEVVHIRNRLSRESPINVSYLSLSSPLAYFGSRAIEHNAEGKYDRQTGEPIDDSGKHISDIIRLNNK